MPDDPRHSLAPDQAAGTQPPDGRLPLGRLLVRRGHLVEATRPPQLPEPPQPLRSQSAPDAAGVDSVPVASGAVASGAAASGLSNAKRSWAGRRGLLLQVEAIVEVAAPSAESAPISSSTPPLIEPPRAAARRWTGLGEASPLPGYSPDTLAAVHAALAGWGGTILDLARPLESVAAAVGELPETLPAARFALETALLDVVAQARGESLPALLRGANGPAHLEDPVPLGLLLDSAAPLEAVLARAEAAFEHGFGTFKVKVGRDTAREDALLEALRRRLGGGVAIRLDANGTLDSRQATARLAELARFEPELLEEPVPVGDLAALGDLPVPLALDESLQPPPPLDTLLGLLADPTVRRPLVAVVLKPAALGGLLVCRELARRAERLGVAAIPSHLFDGPVALRAASALALALPRGPYAAGLAAHDGLRFWPRRLKPASAGSLPAPVLEAWTDPGLGPRLSRAAESVIAAQVESTVDSSADWPTAGADPEAGA